VLFPATKANATESFSQVEWEPGLSPNSRPFFVPNRNVSSDQRATSSPEPAAAHTGSARLAAFSAIPLPGANKSTDRHGTSPPRKTLPAGPKRIDAARPNRWSGKGKNTADRLLVSVTRSERRPTWRRSRPERHLPHRDRCAPQKLGPSGIPNIRNRLRTVREHGLKCLKVVFADHKSSSLAPSLA
jgi:hypothetical protein